MDKITAFIIDDEPHASETLLWELGRACPEVEVTTAFNDPREALKALRKSPPELIFLDVEMPNMSGFELLQELEDLDFGVIFTTAYDQFALKAIKHSAVDYILKPVDGTELKQAVDKFKSSKSGMGQAQLQLLLDRISHPREFGKVALPAGNGLLFVKPETIMYCKSDSNYTNVVFVDGKTHLISRTLREIEDLLDGLAFLRVHHSYLVNMAHVSQFVKSDGGYLVMDDGSQVSVSRSRREELMKRFS